MFHPLFSVLIRKPDLALEHLAGYVALAHAEASAFGTEMALKVAAWATVAVMAVVFITLTGVACMLGAVTEFHWTLVVVPLMALLVALAAFLYARRPVASQRFADLKSQVDADVRALRLAGEGQ